MPYKIHTVLTDNGVQFVQRERGAKGLTFPHIFGRVCLENDIEHRLTKPYHPWTNGQAERMVRTIKEATVKSFHYASIQELRRHLSDWLIAYNFAEQLKALKFRTPYQAIDELWKSKPEAFIVPPNHTHWDQTTRRHGQIGFPDFGRNVSCQAMTMSIARMFPVHQFCPVLPFLFCWMAL